VFVEADHQCPFAEEDCFDVELVTSETAMSTADLRRLQEQALRDADWRFDGEAQPGPGSAWCSPDGGTSLLVTTRANVRDLSDEVREGYAAALRDDRPLLVRTLRDGC
jgi:hypothetical protein